MNKKLISRTLAFVITAFISHVSFSQERTCGMIEHMSEQMQDPEFAREYEKNQEKFREALKQTLQKKGTVSSRLNPVIVPVAVHFPAGDESDRNCLEALAQNQIDILNGDFAATNSDADLWDSASTNYPGVVHGVANVEFCIATLNHPSGTDSDLVEGQPAVTIGYNFGGGGDSDSNWSGYMNFLVKNAGDSVLGYSPLGGNIAAGQSVVISPGAFGSGSGCAGYSPGSPYNLGRTVTHELGHFYNLDHTFSGSCNSDDGIADTPNISQPNYGCSTPGSISGCVTGESALTMSYMDYGNDSCLYMFSEGQTTVVDSYISGVLQSQFKPNTIACGSTDPDFIISAVNDSVESCGDEGSYTIDISSLNGFDEEISLTLSGTPNGASSSLSQPTIVNTGSFNVLVTDLSGLFTANYVITLTASSASITKSIDLDLNIISEVCTSAGNITFSTATTGVIFNTINNLDTSPKTAPYSDFTALSTDLNIGSSYDLTVNVNTDGQYQVVTKVWFDWNQNCSFNDPGEEYDLGMIVNVTNGPTGNSPLAVVVPESAVLGNTTMRVSSAYRDPDQGQYVTACQASFDGEVEDYTVNVTTALSVSQNEFESLSLSPNPNNGSFTLELKSNTSNNVNLNIYDIRGREIHKQAYTNSGNFKQVIALGNIESGLYLMTVSDGLRKTTKRIIIK
tara:strand:+ start:22506 stop:24545 length:2040 start_codon:yes stop_codon:yes gene_type:complete